MARRPFAIVAIVALLCALGATASAPEVLGASSTKRLGATACAALKKQPARKRCLRSRAAFRYVAGRGVARVAALREPARGPSAGPAPSAAAGVAGADLAAPGAPAAGAPAPVAAPVVASTLGVEAHDIGTFVLRLTRTAVPAGRLTIYFRNHDSSKHNLWLAPPQEGTQPVMVSDDVGESVGVTKTVAVTPGRWRLFCSIAGHSSMTRDLAVG